MRTLTMVLVLLAVLLGGCVYRAPVTTEHRIPIDPAVLGLWQELPDPGKHEDPDETMLVLEYSDTEYMVRYPSGPEAMFLRAYPVQVGDLRCVQVQVLGAKDQPADAADRTYHVLTYRLADGILEMKTLNTTLVPGTLATGADVRRAIQANRAHPDLFENPGRFRRLVKG